MPLRTVAPAVEVAHVSSCEAHPVVFEEVGRPSPSRPGQAGLRIYCVTLVHRLVGPYGDDRSVHEAAGEYAYYVPGRLPGGEHLAHMARLMCGEVFLPRRRQGVVRVGCGIQLRPQRREHDDSVGICGAVAQDYGNLLLREQSRVVEAGVSFEADGVAPCERVHAGRVDYLVVPGVEVHPFQSRSIASGCIELGAGHAGDEAQQGGEQASDA